MSLPHTSVATVDSIEFVNLTPVDVNPNMSKCEIKVFYLGKNRNGSFINKDAALNMAKTLRGAPIVGFYSQSKEDFRDHGEKITIDGDGVHFECETKPYGFVAPDSKVWFQDFQETDDFGNQVTRTYLMTEGYLWTGQFKEAQQVLDDNGKPQSMELDEKNLEGHWAIEDNTGMEFFIINDAVISKLCILGDDVEPCFEGAAVTAPETSKNFTLDVNFKNSLFAMMEDLKAIYDKGDNMTEEEKKDFTQDNSVENPIDENQSNIEGQTPESNPSFEQKKDDEDTAGAGASGDEGQNSDPEKPEDDDEKKPAAKNSLHTDEEYAELETKFNDLQTKFDSMKNEMDKLIEFKNQTEDKKKDELIAKFYMLSDEDKKDVIEHKREYSLEDIEAKLAVIGLHKGVNFSLDADSKDTSEGVSVNIDNVGDSTPDWVSVVLAVENNM